MAVWGLTGDAITLPPVRIEAAGSPWLADAAITSWSVERELVGSTLPGQIRFRSGLSVGAAKVAVVREGQTPTPWAREETTKVTVGGPARLFVEAADGDQFDLGRWIVAPTSGALTGPEINVDLNEAQYEVRPLDHALPAGGPFTSGNTASEPVWLIDRMAAQMGYHHVPPAVPSALISLPLVGSFEPDNDSEISSAAGRCDGWDTDTGPVGPTGATLCVPVWASATDPLIEALKAGSIYLTLNAAGVVRFLDYSQGWDVLLDADAETLSVRNQATDAYETIPYVAGASSDWPTRVQIQLRRTRIFDPVDDKLKWTGTEARARSGPAAAWSAWASSSSTKTPSISVGSYYILAGYDLAGVYEDPDPGAISALQITTEADDDLWAPSTADLAPLGGSLPCPFLPAGLDPWGAMQAVAAAWLGAVHLTREGDSARLVLLNRDALAGAATPGVVTDIGREWTDLPWTLDPADRADRLEITYTPPSILDGPTFGDSDYGSWAPEAWRAEDVIRLGPGQTVTIKADIDKYVADIYRSFWGAWVVPDGIDTAFLSFASTFSVFDNAKGQGTHSSANNLRQNTTVVSAARVNLDWTNKRTTDRYLVDAAGEPCLILRAGRVATFDTPQLVERGAAKDQASNPIAIDLGSYVQTAADAEAIADFLWARVSGPGLWRAASIRCRLDWSLDIGQVRQLVHSRTGLGVKALITKVAFAGNAGEITQNIDLVLLPWTWADFDAANAAETWAAWDARWAGRTWADFDSDPLDLAGA